jgi:cell division protein FtsI/penicillin-binding protein 2
MTLGRGSRLGCAVLVAVTVAACGSPTPSPTVYPKPVAPQSTDDVPTAAQAFLGDWRDGRYAAMYRRLTAADRDATTAAAFTALLRDFRSLARVTAVDWQLAAPQRLVLPPAPRPPDAPAPTPTAAPSGATPQPTQAGASPTPRATPVPPDTPLAGPRLAVQVPVHLSFTTDNFGDVALDRNLVLVPAAGGWQVDWTAATLFPELGSRGTLALRRQEPVRGQIVAQDGTVFARTRSDGARVYPQEWLAGQTIGYATPATQSDLKELASRGVRRGDLVGRSGLEAGADALLAGTPGFKLVAVPADGKPVTVLQRDVVPGADVVITIRPRIQATADAALAPYAEAGTAVLNPKNGDVWALASAPRFNPNSMTIGATLSGLPLADPGLAARTSHAVLGAYPAGSSFKVFTLAAALKLGVADASTRMTCNGTWTFDGFTFHNYMDHHLGVVDLLQAMAFSCNTTYMPLSIQVYDKDKTALTDVVGEFGFGQSTGIEHLADEPGVLPDAAYFRKAKRWDGKIHPYGPFDQIQLAIGQGSYLGTPLQLANAYAAIGNGGKLWVPRIMAEARLPDGTVVERVKHQLQRRVSVGRGQLRYVVESMKAVVNYPYGTGYPAFVGYPIQVAGKSGTAETGGPDPDAWFPAIAPADNPRIAAATVLVRIKLGTGGTDAAPLVRRVFSTYFSGGG